MAEKVAVMLSRSVDVLPTGAQWTYEPKLDGFRCVLSTTEFGDVFLTSRRGRPLGRYFPEIVAAARALPAAVVLDGELVVPHGTGVDFTALQHRLHPATARPAELARTSPAALVCFDLLDHDGHDLRGWPLRDRRRALEELLAAPPAGVGVMPAVTDPWAASAWLRDQPPGVEGIVAKRLDQPYRPGIRTWQKLRARRSTDAVVGGLFGTLRHPDGLVLGRYEHGRLRVVGRTGPLSPLARAELLPLLHPPHGPHPWPVRLPASRFGQTPGRDVDYTQVEPEVVVEVETDTAFEQGRWRHAARYLRHRADLSAADLLEDSA